MQILWNFKEALVQAHRSLDDKKSTPHDELSTIVRHADALQNTEVSRGFRLSQNKPGLFAGYAFSTPPASDPFGNLGRNAFRAPGFEQWDASIFKFFSVREKVRLQFRAEFFDVLNHTNFGIPNTQTTSAAFGTIRTTYPSRVGQFALKLLF